MNLVFVALPHDAVGWSSVCDCGISRSYSLTFCVCNLFRYAVLSVLSSFAIICWGRESWLLYFNCLPDIMWLLVFCDSTSR